MAGERLGAVDDIPQGVTVVRVIGQRPGVQHERRKIAGQTVLENAFVLPLGRALQIRSQQQQRTLVPVPDSALAHARPVGGRSIRLLNGRPPSSRIRLQRWIGAGTDAI